MKKTFFRLFSQIFKESSPINAVIPNLAVVSRRDLNIWKALQNKQMRDWMLNRPQEKILFMPNTENEYNLNLKKEINTLHIVTQKSFILSGLKDIPVEYFAGDIIFKEIYKRGFLITIFKILYTLGRYRINNDEAVFMNIDKFLFSIVPSLHKIEDYKIFRDVYLSKYMGNIQHILVYFFRNKKFKIHLFEKYMLNKVDYNMFKYATILNVIEMYAMKKNTSDLLDFQSFVAIDHESELLREPAAIYGYNCNVSQITTGQKHVDFIGVQAICDENGNIELVLCYKDVKMYESGSLKGRITLKPELTYNERYLKEYISKHISTLKEVLKKNNLDKKHPCFDFLRELLEQEKKIKQQTLQVSKNIIDDFINEDDILQIQKELRSFNEIILQYMRNPKIAAIINLGLSADPGRDEEFIIFMEKYLHSFLAEIMKLSDDEFLKLHSSKITPENEVFLYEKQKEWAQFFPEQLEDGFNLREHIQKSIEYLNTK